MVRTALAPAPFHREAEGSMSVVGRELCLDGTQEAKLDPEVEKRRERERHVSELHRGLAGGPGIVPDPFLHVAVAGAVKLDHDLGVDEEVVFLEVKRCQGLSAEELERAVQIPDRHSEGEGREGVVAVRDHEAKGPVLAAHTVAEKGVVLLHVRKEIDELLEVELIVRVGIEDEPTPGGVEPGPKRGPVSEGGLMGDDREPTPQLLPQPGENRRCLVAAPVIHGHDLEIFDQRGDGLGGAPDGALDASLFVVRGKNDGQGFRGWAHDGSILAIRGRDVEWPTSRRSPSFPCPFSSSSSRTSRRSPRTTKTRSSYPRGSRGPPRPSNPPAPCG